MPLNLRRRNISCFYCGRRSKHSGPVPQFQCEYCEAVNYLDENGQITDPPAQSTPSASETIRYARPSSPSSSPSDIFCQTCLKNQHLLKETLASYLPPEDDPQYDQYLASYDAYHEKLEQRYPQVCPQCAPRARDRIKKAVYVAKTDHLRRMMDRTRQGKQIGGLRVALTGLVIRLGAVGWIGSAVVQASWHILAAVSVKNTLLPAEQFEEVDIPYILQDFSLSSCVRQTLHHRRLRPSCLSHVTTWLPSVCVVALVSMWWNNQLRTKYIKTGGIMLGLGEYYTLQLVTVVVRIVAAYYLNPEAAWLDGEMLKGAHLSMAMLILTVTAISSRIVKLDMKPRVSFHMTDESVLPDIQPAAYKSTTPSRASQLESAPPFPINRLATPSKSQTPRQTHYHPPTPPPEVDYDDNDEMDWTPSNKTSSTTFNPRPRTSIPIFAPTGPSPFHGTLPSAPMAPAHRLRNPGPLQAGAFRKATDVQKATFSANLSTSLFSTPPRRYPAPHMSAFGNDEDDNDRAAGEDSADHDDGGRRRRHADMQVAPPRFWPPTTEAERDTGLESMFEEGFSIRDTPKEVLRFAERGGAMQNGLRSVPGGGRGNALVNSGGNGAGRRGERWGGFGDVVGSGEGEAGAGAAAVDGDSMGQSEGWGGVLAVGLVPVAILGVAFSIVKGGWI